MASIPVVDRICSETGQSNIYPWVSSFLRVAEKQQIYRLLNEDARLFKQTDEAKLKTTAEAIILLMFLGNIQSLALMILS